MSISASLISTAIHDLKMWYFSLNLMIICRDAESPAQTSTSGQGEESNSQQQGSTGQEQGDSSQQEASNGPEEECKGILVGTVELSFVASTRARYLTLNAPSVSHWTPFLLQLPDPMASQAALQSLSLLKFACSHGRLIFSTIVPTLLLKHAPCMQTASTLLQV